jgi:MoCo/4Fe-4S cofactor protein with predicted Tat translocation signal
MSEGLDPMLASVRRRLESSRGRAYWRSLEELAEDDGFRRLVAKQFPNEAESLLDPVNRRRFLQLMGASLALAGLGACTRQPREEIVPYVRQPEQIVPGKPLYFATAAIHAGYATGILVESHMGRPTKVEGNPDHPASLGATDVFAQASVLDLYDPDRSQVTTHLARIRPWGGLAATLQVAVGAIRSRGGAGLRILSGAVTSPTLAGQIQSLLRELPEARWHRWEPISPDARRIGAKRAFGSYVDSQLRLDRADVVLALESDFLADGPGSLRYARDFGARRRASLALGTTGRRPIRLYAAESAPTTTGASADHRLPLRAAEVEGFARAVAGKLGIAAGSGISGEAGRFAEAVAADLAAHRGRALVVAGDGASATVHALAHAMNATLGAIGETVVHTDPVEADPVEHLVSIRSLAEDMEAGAVDLLVVLEGNPVYDAPADLRFAERLQKVGLRVHLGLYANETAELCHWHVPAAHPLESWSDARAYDGTAISSCAVLPP